MAASTSALHVLAKEGDNKTLSVALKNADPDVQDNDGMRPLHYAAWYGHTSCLQTLIGAGADVNAHDHDGATPVHAGAFNGQLATVVALVEAGADCTLTDNDNATPSQVAAEEGHPEVELFLKTVEDDQKCDKVLVRMEEAYNEAKEKSKQSKLVFAKTIKDAKKRVADLEKEQRKMIKNTLRNKKKKKKETIDMAGPKMSFSQMTGIPSQAPVQSDAETMPSAMRTRRKSTTSDAPPESPLPSQSPLPSGAGPDLEMILAQLGADHGDREALNMFLASIDLREVARMFEAEEWTLERLVCASAVDLKELGLPAGIRKKIMQALRQF